MWSELKINTWLGCRRALFSLGGWGRGAQGAGTSRGGAGRCGPGPSLLGNEDGVGSVQAPAQNLCLGA